MGFPLDVMGCPWATRGMPMGCPWAVRAMPMGCPWDVHGTVSNPTFIKKKTNDVYMARGFFSPLKSPDF